MPRLERTTRAVLCLALAQTLFLSTQAADDEGGRRRLMFDDVVPGTPSQAPSGFKWSPDGTRLGFLRHDGVDHALWLAYPTLGRTRRVIGTGELETGRDTLVAIDEFHWAPSGRAVLIEAGGDLYLADTTNRAMRRLTQTDAEEKDPKFAPDGVAVAFSREHDLWLLDLDSGAEVPLTTGGRANHRLNGETDWLYWEEIRGRDSTGYWWSPQGDRLAYYQFDETPVRTYALVDFMPLYPEVQQQKYPKAGESNPVVRIGVASVTDGKTVWMNTGPDDVYLARVHWTPDGREVAIQRLNREQDRLELLLCRAADGACRTLLTESWPTWVNLGNDFAFLPDGRFIWGSERLGWRHLYLYDAAGKRSKRLTPDGWAITSLDMVDEEAGELVVGAFRTEPWGATDRHVLRVPLDPEAGRPVEVLTADDGWNTAVAAPGTGLWVHTWSDVDTPPRWLVRGAVLDIPYPLPAPDPGYDPTALPRWEFLSIDGPSGAKLPAMMLMPDTFRSGRSYPVIMYHYGGPGSQVVANRWGGRGRNVWHKMMAQNGYVIFSVDNEASLFFGKDGEDRAHRRFGEINLGAQRAAVEHLVEKSFVDGARIGLWGWSGGGTNTLYCLLNSPGTWRAGMSGAPVTDWRLYDSIWTERYLGHPRENPDGYRDSSPVTHAAKLKDRLLIVHGTADDNVHPQNTLRMIEALVKAGVLYEDAIYPREKHGFRGDSSRHFYRRMTEFFDQNLAAE